MALVKCPECGKNRVSDSAEACPECGFGIKSYYDKIRLQTEQQNQNKLQIVREETKPRQDIDESDGKKSTWSLKRKVVLGVISCSIVCLCVLGIIFIHNEKEIRKVINHSYQYFDAIQDEIPEFCKRYDNFYYYPSPDKEPTILEREGMEAIENALVEINRNVNVINAECNRHERVRQSIDNYISLKTTYKSWEEYKQFIIKKYLVAETPQKSAEFFIKQKTYDSLEELQETKRSKSLIIQNYSGKGEGNYFVVSGSVKNNTSATVRFVVVKIELIDKNGNVFDSDTTYAVGEEGISPGNSAKFECYLDNDINIEKYSASIFSYR